MWKIIDIHLELKAKYFIAVFTVEFSMGALTEQVEVPIPLGWSRQQIMRKIRAVVQAVRRERPRLLRLLSRYQNLIEEED